MENENKDLTQSLTQNYENHLVPAAAGGILSAAQKIPAVANIVSKVGGTVGKIASSIGLGGVTQDRFFDRYFEIRDWFIKYGYLQLGSKFHEDALTKFKIRKTQVTDKKSKGNYEPEFARLHAWCVYVMNHANPGLGTVWSNYYPQFQMANLGNIVSSGALQALKEIVQTYPPGSFVMAIHGAQIPSQVTPIIEKEKPTPTPEPVTNEPEVKEEIKEAAGFTLDKNTMIMMGIVVGVIVLFVVFKGK